ncbi:hypothetical protein [Bradyrhizobium sp.]|uniref:hypothetical protein n=1 Tax=Bradyrhizobium sp. TaxID=376 RepID=UPI003C387AD0
MIDRDASPIGHIPPLRPIDLRPKYTPYSGPALPLDGISIHHKNRIWRLVRETAEGVNAPALTPAAPVLPPGAGFSCDTCRDTGEIDQRIGGDSHSPTIKCPDCRGVP